MHPIVPTVRRLTIWRGQTLKQRCELDETL